MTSFFPRLSCRALMVAGLVLLHVSLPAFAQEQVILTLGDEPEAYGSGPAVLETHYQAGGLERIGLFAGNPNQLTRRDRVLLRFNLEPILLHSAGITAATLKLSFDKYISQEEQQSIEIVAFDTAPETLSGRDLNDPNVKIVATLEVSSGDAGPAPRVFEMDVAPVVQEAMKNGAVAVAFRVRSLSIEEGGPTGEVNGVSVASSRGKLPELIIELSPKQ